MHDNTHMDESTLERIAEFICGDDESFAPVYRSSTHLTRFFRSVGLPRFRHDGSTRKWWVLSCLQQCTPAELERAILRLASPKEYSGNREQLELALTSLRELLAVEGFDVSVSGTSAEIRRIEVDYSGPEMEARVLRPEPPPEFQRLGLESAVASLLELRWHEAERCVGAQAYLAGIIIMGSLLEGLLLGVAQSRPKEANMSRAAPRDIQTGRTKPFHDWTLSQMIDVAHAESWIDLDVKRFSHALRSFRNLVHPYQQQLESVSPDADTCQMCWLVVQAASNDLARTLAGGRG